MLRLLRIVALVLFLISLFVTFELCIDRIFSEAIELNDRLTVRGFLQETVGALEHGSLTLSDFFTSLEASALLTLLLLILNIVLLAVNKNS